MITCGRRRTRSRVAHRLAAAHRLRAKRGKLRGHVDLYVVADGSVADEVRRLIALGARRVDVGQTGDEGFEVLADPEGNEFCVLHRRWRRP